MSGVGWCVGFQTFEPVSLPTIRQNNNNIKDICKKEWCVYLYIYIYIFIIVCEVCLSGDVFRKKSPCKVYYGRVLPPDTIFTTVSGENIIYLKLTKK